jgi:hypothetical protein
VAKPSRGTKPDTVREATGEHLTGSPGWLGTARVDRSAEEPGRPCKVGAKVTNARREDITGVAAGQGVGEAHTSEEAG